MMASSSRRRSRRQAEEEEEDMEFAHSPSTHRTSMSPETVGRPEKRQRTSTRNSTLDAGAFEEEIEEVEIDDGIEMGDIDEEDEGDDSDVEATQHENTQLLQRIENSRSGVHKANEAEVIKSIDLINFMCHKRLHVPLGDKINFIIGHNGSGKSAILTALTICLGGKATATNRGSSLKNLIKEGENSAAIIIKLLNAGDNAYKPELYGDVIEIERRFSKDGSSGYKIKSSTGHTVSTKREELQEIMDHINLQVDNPMTVLTQDTARQFLGNSSAGDKYKLFMRGVQLAQLDTDYNMVEEQISALETTLETKKEALDDLHEKEKLWRMKVDIFKQSAAIEEKIRTYQNHFAWGQVKAQEKTVEENERKIQDFLARIDAAKEKVGVQERRREEQDLIVQQATDAADALKAQKDAVKQGADEAKESVNAVTAKLKENENDQSSVEATVKQCEDTIKKNQELIKEERRREGNDGQRQRDQNRLTELETSITDLTDQVLELEESHRQKNAEVKEAESRERTLVNRKQSVMQALSSAKEQLNQLQLSKNSEIAKYHRNMPRVLAAIEKQKNRFRSMPIGPMGRHVKIKQEKWAGICETIFGRILNGFLCADHGDEKLLRDILNQCQCDVPVVRSERDLFDYRGGEPDPQFDTVLRILEISDEFVKRQLINQNRIESTILIENRAEADEVMYRRPAKVSSCFALNPGRPGCGYKVGGVAGGSGTAPVGPWKQQSRLTNRSIDDQIAEKTEEVDRCDREVKDAEAEILAHRQRLRRLRDDYRAVGVSKTQVETAKDRAIQDAEELRENLQTQQPDSGRIVAYEAAIADAQEEKRVQLTQIAAIIEESKRLLEERLPLLAKAKEMVAAVKKLSEDIEKAEKECTKVTAERMQITTNINHYKKQVTDTETAYEIARAELDNQKQALEDIIEGARRYCPERVPNEEIKLSVDKIKEKMKVLQRQMANMATEAGMSEEEAHRKFSEVHEQYKTANHEMRALQDLKEVLWNSYRERKSRYYKFRKIIAVKAKTTFMHLLKQRAFVGKLKFDHKKQEIRLEVNPAGESSHGTRKDPKSLSGGEKSFAQICMLLSVWEAMGSPIRALDEFDVFMDAVNRKTSMALMIEAAQFSVGKQFILITPQDMGNVAMGPGIRVHRMRDPERGQQTLD